MTAQQDDVVTQYLREVEQRVADLPLLQRRELLADLAAHIEAERTERDVQTESELIEILERLGSPEVVAAAAFEQAGPSAAAPTAGRAKRPGWVLPAGIIAAIVLVFVICGTSLATWSDQSDPSQTTRVQVDPSSTSPAPRPS